MHLKQRDKRAISSVTRGFTNVALDRIFEKRKLRARALARIFLVNPVENYFTIQNIISDLIKIVVQLVAFKNLTESIGSSSFQTVIIRTLACTLLTWIIAKLKFYY